MNVSKKGLLDLVNCVSLKDLDAASAIEFSLPGMCVVISGEVLWTCCLNASALMRHATITDVVEDCLLVQWTVDMLSQKMLMCL